MSGRKPQPTNGQPRINLDLIKQDGSKDIAFTWQGLAFSMLVEDSVWLSLVRSGVHRNPALDTRAHQHNVYLFSLSCGILIYSF